MQQPPIAFTKSSASFSVLSRISPNHNPGALGPQGVSRTHRQQQPEEKAEGLFLLS